MSRRYTRPRHAVASRARSLPRHTPRVPAPRILQRWLSQARQQTRRRRCPRPWQVQHSPSFVCVNAGGSTPLASVLAFPLLSSSSPMSPARLAPHSPCSAAQVQANCSAGRWRQRRQLHIPLGLSPSHTTIASPCLGNAASRVTVAAAAVFAIAIATVTHYKGITSTVVCVTLASGSWPVEMLGSTCPIVHPIPCVFAPFLA